MTSPARRPLIAGNWKLHRDVQESVELARAVSDGSRIGPRTDVVVAPVFTALHAVAQALRGTRVQVSAQDVYWEKQGAFTGEVSAPMLRDVGCTYCIVGHSERRQFFGETLSERESGITYDVLRRQIEGMLGGVTGGDATRLLDGLVLAYEPVWAIGTGRTAKSADAQLAHGYLRDRLRSMHGDLADGVRILYGGSVKADNAAEILAQPDIDGVLVGGASLDAAGFARIIQAAG